MFFQGFALVVLALFYGCYFAKMFAQKRQGIRTNQMGRNTSGFVKGIELGVKFVSLLVPLAELANILRGASGLPLAARAAGVFLSAAGVALFYAAVLAMRGSWRAGIPQKGQTSLVTSGIFSVSRNPAFLGFDLVYLGILLMFFSWSLLLLSALMILLLHLQILNAEEEFLLDAFGEEYLAYKKRVNRYFGMKS